FTSPGWVGHSAGAGVGDHTLRPLATMTTVLIYVQILIGAAMRHTGAGLAIPDFPMMFGGIVPNHWNPAIAVHFAHRVGGIVVSASVAAVAAGVWRHRARRRELTRPAAIIVVLVL